MKRTAAFGSQTRVLDTVRRVEVAGLVALSLVLAVQHPPDGLAAASAMLLIAAFLLPRTRQAEAVSREDARMAVLNQLQSEALDLRTRYMAAREHPLTLNRSNSLWEVRRDITIWLTACQKQIAPYPEFSGIFKARRGHGGVIDELDRCLNSLSELKRLASLSKRLQLPI
jgi:hypothetical protein